MGRVPRLPRGDGRQRVVRSDPRQQGPDGVHRAVEDTAALLGLALATLGIFLAQVLDLPVLDGVAPVVIGLILAGTAAFLALECRSLLTGEGVAPSMSHRTHYGIRHTQNWNAEFWFQEARVPCANFFARSYFMLVAGQRPPSP